MKILHISSNTHGGAGSAAARIHKSFLKHGHDSKMFVRTNQNSIERVIEFNSTASCFLTRASRKIKNKLRQKGFEQKTIDDFILNQLQEDPDFEVKILKKYIQKKKIGSLEVSQLKKKLYQQSFNENSIYKIINE